MTIRRTLMVAVACLTATAACTNSPQHIAGQAGPDGAASPATSPPVTARPSVSSSSAAAKTSAAPKRSSRPPIKRVIGPANVLGPTGLSKLQIGMSKKDAEATGTVWAAEGSADCGSWYLKASTEEGVTVGWTARGVVSIPAYGEIATPEGIRIGSTLADLERAYDDLDGVAADMNSGSLGDGPAVAGEEDEHRGVHYRFVLRARVIVKLALEHDQPSC